MRHPWQGPGILCLHKQDVAFNQTEEQKNFSNKVAGKNITCVMQVNDTA